MEDMAVAVLDEIERPAHRRALFTVASSRQPGAAVQRYQQR